MNRFLIGLAAGTIGAWCQAPVISPGGVVNAASYTTGIGGLTQVAYPQTGGGPVLAEGSIVSIFGTNLAASPMTAQTTPLPIKLGGTSVSVNGVAAPLFYVSPTQINFQMPSSTDTTQGASTAAGVVVSTAGGQSDPYTTVDGGVAYPVPGIFTSDSSGCGQGAVLNVSSDGSVSINSPTNSASPGDFISIYGTGNGFVYNAPPDGMPAQSSSPLAFAASITGPIFDFAEGGYEGPDYWTGRAPGYVGVDQFNWLVPTTVRQGCAVPLQLVDGNVSRPVTISIASGGPCTDPPAEGYGQIVWEKTITTSEPYAVSEADTVTVSLQASPGKQAPAAPVYTDGGYLPGASVYFGASCPIPGYRSLDAGVIAVTGPGLSSTPIAAAPLPASLVVNTLPGGGASTFAWVPSGQAAGLTQYQATLPNGTIQPGAFTIAASGGADVRAFQSTVQIGSPIDITVGLAGLYLQPGPPFAVTWTGGDPNSWVTLRLVGHGGPENGYPYQWVARASDGAIVINDPPQPPGLGIAGPVDLVMEVVPDPSQIPSFSASGLSLGGQATWKYKYVFEGVLVQEQ